MRRIMHFLPIALALNAGAARAADDPTWLRLKACLARAEVDPAVHPLSVDHRAAALRILCQPQIERAERHMQGQMVERGLVTDPDKLAHMPAVVHRGVDDFVNAYASHER